jgi:hypothetical protein
VPGLLVEGIHKTRRAGPAIGRHDDQIAGQQPVPMKSELIRILSDIIGPIHGTRMTIQGVEDAVACAHKD